ncbi:MAG: hypothetical protein VKM17_06500 [Cyanobacteriota bacterium]|nr:hypothetical protein [Cyanobacteriota bacterium]
MTATAALPPAWEIRSELPGRLRLAWEPLRHSPALRRRCSQVLTACHWLEGFRLNRLAGSLSVCFPQDRRAEVTGLLAKALASPLHGSEDHPAAARPPGRSAPPVLRHGALCALVAGLDLWLGLPALLINGTAALLTLPLLLRALEQLQRQPPRLTDALDVGFSALLLGQGLGREALLDQVLEDSSLLLQRLGDQAPKTRMQQDLLIRLGDQVHLQPVEGAGSLPLAAVQAGDRLRLGPGTPVLLPLEVQEGVLGVIRPGGRGIWSPHQVGPSQRLEPGWLVLSGEGVARVERSFREDPHYHLTSGLPTPPSADSWRQRLLHLHFHLLEPLLLVLGGTWALGGATERAMAAFQFNPLSDWQTSQMALRLATQADLRLHGLHLAHPQVLVDLARLDRLLVSPGCLDRLARLAPKEQRAPQGGWPPGDLLRLLASVQCHLLDQQQAPDWFAGFSEALDPWPLRHVTCLPEPQGWQVELEDGRQVSLTHPSLPADRQRVDILEVRQGEVWLGSILLERETDPTWQQVCQQLTQMGIEVVPLDPSDDAEGDEATWRLDAVTALQEQGLVVAWLGDGAVDIPAMARAEVAIGLTFAESNLLPAPPFDLMLGDDPLWLPRLVTLSRKLARTSTLNLWLIGLTHAVSSVATAGLAISPLQTVLLADLPLLLAELHNRQAPTRPPPAHLAPLMRPSQS